MFLHRCHYKNANLFTLFDSKERVVTYPTLYLNRLRINKRSAISQRHIAYVIKYYLTWLEEFSYFRDLRIDESLPATQGEDILDWINYQREQGLSENTIHNREIVIREMYKWFTTEEASVRKDIPWNKRSYTKQQHKKLPRFLTAEQVIKLLLGMHNESQRVAAHFIFDTGVRISELIRFKQKHLPSLEDYPAGANYYLLRVSGSKSYDGNTFKMRDTIISRPMLARLQRYHSTPEYKLARSWNLYDPEKPVFLNVKGEPLSKSSVYKTIKSAWIRQGGAPEKASPHRLRHGTAFSVLRSEFGRELLDNLLILKGMFGHEDIKTTEIYSQIPIVVMQFLASRQDIRLRYEEADQIYQLTYLPGYKHIEKRGRRNNEEKYAN